MFGKEKFGLVFNTIFSLMFAVCLPLFLDWQSGMLGVERFCQSSIMAFCITFTMGSYIDLKAMGDFFARICGAKNENGTIFHILRVISITFVMTFLMSLVMMFLDVGFSLGSMFFIVLLKSFPLTFVFALAVAFVTFAVAMPLTGALCSKSNNVPTTSH